MSQDDAPASEHDLARQKDGPPHPPAELPRAKLVGFTATMALAMAVATLPLISFGIISPFLLETFGISRSQLGLLLTGTTGMAALLSLLVGRLADSLGGKRLVMLIFTGGILVFLAMSIAPSFGLLVAAAVIAGFGNAAANPGTNRLIGGRLPPGRRGVIMGVKQSGVQGGLAAAGLYLPITATAFGWRVAVATMAVIPVIGLLCTLLLVPSDPHPARPRSPETPAYRASVGIRWLATYAFLLGAGQAVFIGFLPLYAHESLGLSVTGAGATVGLLGVLGVVFRIAWGRASERAHHMSSPLMILVVIAMAAIALVLGAQAVPALVWVAVLLAAASLAAWNAVVMLAVLGEASAANTGRASGLVNAGFMGGMAGSPTLFGFSVDATGGYTIGWLSVMALFALAVVGIRLWQRDVRKSAAAVLHD